MIQGTGKTLADQRCPRDAFFERQGITLARPGHIEAGWCYRGDLVVGKCGCLL
jgi:hypothetical protein